MSRSPDGSAVMVAVVVVLEEVVVAMTVVSRKVSVQILWICFGADITYHR